jgi:hypothetical protein
MLKKAVVMLIGTMFVVGCDRTYSPSSPSVAGTASPSSDGTASSSGQSTLAAQGPGRVGFGFNGTVSGFPTGEVFLTGGGSYNPATNSAKAGGGFRCLKAVLQGPLNSSINQSDPGGCGEGEGVRWDTAALLASTTFKCTGAASEPLKTATTSDTTVVLKADFYRASNGNDESFTAQMIASDGDIDLARPGIQNLWVQGVGCGTASEMNFSK